MEYRALTDVGLKRTNNEDSYLINDGGEKKLFVIADGMGGHNAGEIASSEACAMIEKYIKTHDGAIDEVLKEAVCNANRQLFVRASENNAMSGMGTTIDALIAEKDKIHIAHVGDSRVYIVSNDAIRKVTHDHSIVGMMVDSGSITEEEARVHPQRNLITRAVGTAMTIEVDIVDETIHNGEWILMCTDGLTNMVPKDEIHRIITTASNIDEAAEKLVDTAKKNGGDDNITVILLSRHTQKGRNK